MYGRIREALREERRIPATPARVDASESAITSRDCWRSIETVSVLGGGSAGAPLDGGIQETPPPITSSTAPDESRISLQNWSMPMIRGWVSQTASPINRISESPAPPYQAWRPIRRNRSR